MKVTQKNLVETVKKLVAKFVEHDGSNGGAHLPASADRNGFMSNEDKTKLDQVQLNAPQIADGTDILTLTPGQYLGRNLKNMPTAVTDKTYCLVHVQGNSYYKTIALTQVSTGYRFYRNIYGSTDSGWFDNRWVNIPTAGGWDGTFKARRFMSGDHVDVEMRMDIKGSLATKGVVQVGTLPGLFEVDSNVGSACIAFADSTPAPAFITITNGNKINLANSSGTTINAASLELTWKQVAGQIS